MFRFISSKRFMIQLILIFLLFTLGTIVGLGIPAALIIRQQMHAQLHTLIDQTNQTTLALVESKSGQFKNLVMLIAERPTINQLILEDQDYRGLSIYLEDFLDNAVIDAVAICDSNVLLAAAGESVPPDLCEFEISNVFSMTAGEAWLLSRASLTGSAAGEIQVVIGQSADNILQEFSTQSGLDYVLFHNNEPLSANFMDISGLWASDLHSNIEHYQIISLMDDDGNYVSYMAANVPVPDHQPFTMIGLLNIETFTALNRQLRNLILATLLVVSLVGAFVAVLVSRRISKPLNELAQSAASLREGDLTTPLVTSSDIWEIDQLTNTLEDARVSLKHSLDQLRVDKLWVENLLNSIIEGLLTIDEKNRITYVSDAIERLLGVDSSHILGRFLDDFFVAIPGEDLFSQQMHGQNQGWRIPVMLNGREVLLNVSASAFVPQEAGNATRALVIRDVTDEERIHRLIGDFMANITHEFRTPLTALSASVELLVDQLPTLSTPEISQLLHALNIGIIDLQSLIDNLIEAASIEAGRFKVNPQNVELNAIIQTAVNTVQPIAKKYKLTIRQPKEKQSFLVNADKRRTSQALINLLSNAIKHSPEGANIIISTLILEQDILVEVRDEGPGVSPDRQSQLFNRFISPGPENDFSQIGLGLGLSVVKAIIEAQHGKVGFKESELGSAIFWFTLPMVIGDTS